MVVRADGEKKVLKKDQVQQASGLSIRSIKEGLKVFNKGQVQQGKWIKKNCTHMSHSQMLGKLEYTLPAKF